MTKSSLIRPAEPISRTAIVAEARPWLGTPWHHQAAAKGVGCDCIGLIRGVAEPFLGPIDIALDYSPRWHLYRAEPLMHRIFSEWCEEIDPAEAQAGDVLCFGVGKGPAHHCGYVSPVGLIHCYREAGRVVEQSMTEWWRRTDGRSRAAAQLRHAFRFPGAE